MLLASVTRNWWIVLLRGIFAVLCGIFVLTRPGHALATLVMVLGLYAILDGLAAISVGLTGVVRGDRW